MTEPPLIGNDPAAWVIVPTAVSTNEELMSGKQPPGSVLMAATQSGGRGRRGRTWFDSPGDAFLFSCVFELDVEKSGPRLRMIPLATGVALCAAVRESASLPGEHPPEKFQIKWPNDIWAVRDGRAGKLAGILVESVVTGQRIRIVIGIGLNWRKIPQGLMIPAHALFPDTKREPREFARILVPHLNRWLSVLFSASDGVSQILGAMRRDDFLAGRHVRYAGRTCTSRGVNEEGELVLVDTDHKEIIVSELSQDLEVLEVL